MADWQPFSNHVKACITERACVSIVYADVSPLISAQQVMDTLLEGVADNALSVLQKSPDVNEEDAIPTCVLVCESYCVLINDAVSLITNAQLTSHPPILLF